MDALNANRKTKQVRKPNYIYEEITVLPEEVATNKVIIQSTLNSAEVTGQQKGQLWRDIARKGNSRGVCVRTPDQVREKLSDMKKDFFFREEKTTTKQQQQQERNKQIKQQMGELGPSGTNRLTSY